MTITKKNSGIEVSDIIGGYLVSKLYIGYTVKEAKSLFNAEYKKGAQQMNDYTVLVDLKGEAISLAAGNNEEAIARAKEIIKEQYGESVATDAVYSVEA